MIALTLALILVSLGLLIAGLSTSGITLLIGSIVASVLAFAALFVAVRRRGPAAAGAALGGADRAAGYPANQPANQPVDQPAVEPDQAADQPADRSAVEPDQTGGPDRPTDSPAGHGQPATTLTVPAPPADEPMEEAVGPLQAAVAAASERTVQVVDGRPRYHLPGCSHLTGRPAVPLTAAQAVAAGFSPCALCRPATTLAGQAGGR